MLTFFAKGSLAMIYVSLCKRPEERFTKTSRLTNRSISQMRFDCERDRYLQLVR